MKTIWDFWNSDSLQQTPEHPIPLMTVWTGDSEMDKMKPADPFLYDIHLVKVVWNYRTFYIH